MLLEKKEENANYEPQKYIKIKIFKNFYSLVMENRHCEYCNKRLIKIGRDRLNAPITHYDWNNRRYHKKCYFIVMVSIEKHVIGKY